MFIVDLIIMTALLVAAAFLVTRSVRARRELKELKSVKAARRQQLRSSDTQSDILCLLEPDEVQLLLTPSGPLPKWLGTKSLSRLTRFEAAWYAGYARSRVRVDRYGSAVAAAIGGLTLARYVFTSFDRAFAVEVTAHAHLLPALADSISDTVAKAVPILIAFGGLALGVGLKERSDEYDFYAGVLEEQAKAASE
ncbi:hypothetical protein O6P37_25490 [Mycobacterium sp. CPCC 205372]|uniref:Integral membrane protein n=1 Tax=Mycobacterium hippophais TaxID=3016340 RepID=A0ABT4Q068_9MYCO|nr:hypothetical protein [Mycobacterium hippophais]MCZ8382229.1 hypothetical protein [Mycobacterium hippophais]